MLSVKQGGIKYHFWVFGMTWPGIERRCPGPLRLFLSNTNDSIYYKSIVSTRLNVFKYCYVSLTIQLNISHLFTYVVHSISFQTFLYRHLELS